MKSKQKNKTKQPKSDKKSGKFKFSNLGEKILTIFMIGLIAIFACGVTFFAYIVISAPAFNEDELVLKEASIIYDVKGTEVKRLGAEKRESITYDELPEIFIDALIATEDARFFQHSGVDMGRFIKATLGQLMGNSSAGGASTLTMQVVKQQFTDSTSTGIKGIIRKFTDVYMAVFKLEKKYTKEQLIEFYVNIPYLGGGSYGIKQAAQTYFNKEVGELTLPEAALIAGLFQAPDAFDPFTYPDKAQSRRDQVLALMLRHEYITDEEYTLAKAISVESLLATDNYVKDENQGAWDTIVQEVIDRTGDNPYLVSMKIYSTINLEKQAIVNKITNNPSFTYPGKTYKWINDNLQTGIAVIDVKTGGIAAVGAGRNKKGEMSYNYATMIKRHPGSTAKPLFDYGPAIQYLNWGTGQMIIDDAHTYSNGISVKNFDGGYKGIQTIKQALAQSRNVPALKAFQANAQQNINEFVSGLGMNPEYDSTGFINESHSLGGFSGTNPVQLAAAYATFANGGVYIEPHSFTKLEYTKTGDTYTVTPEKRKVMDDSTAYLINNMLTYAVSSGTVGGGSKSGTDVASKTGTSSVDSKVKKEHGITASIIGDSWQVTYSPDYACATWIGYDKITKTTYLTQSTGNAARGAVTKALANGVFEPNSRFTRPSSVVSATIELETNPVQLASEFTPAKLKSTEWFKKGTAPSEMSYRFSQLNAPTNLSISSTGGITTLTWNPITLPNAIDPVFLVEYFNNGFGRSATKYYNQRLTYNNANIGNIGYQIYITQNGITRDLGWTANANYTYTNPVTDDAIFTVKASYSIFKANASNGVTVKVIDDPGYAIFP